MHVCRVYSESYTMAMKAVKILSGYGIRAAVKRTSDTRTEGCGFVTEADAACTDVSAILSKHGIPYKRLENMRR